MATTIIFYILAAIILISALLAVTTKHMMRSATYLMFVLFGTAGLYFLMGYPFLGSVQIMVYAGGVVVLYIFALMLTGRKDAKEKSPLTLAKKMAALIACLGGAAIILFVIISHKFIDTLLTAPSEQHTTVTMIGQQLLTSDKYGYLLPFEAVSVLLLACIIGGLIIARKR